MTGLLGKTMKKKIMAVDDEAIILKLMEQILSREGYEVTTTTNGHEALKILEKEEIRVFFLDLKMPDMDGIELCKKIKEIMPVACIYAVTGYVSDFHIEWCREAGFDDYFVKPFTVETIVNAAAEAFEKLERWDEQKSQVDKESKEKTD